MENANENIIFILTINILPPSETVTNK